MATLHIEHQISDLNTWLTAFANFAEARQKAGVRAQRVYQPIDDNKYVVLDLDFDAVDDAVRFKKFLESNVWSSRDASPGLAGAPQARVLQSVPTRS
ncbi:MAG TPA: hypothetical protein VE641_20050 [Chthoniobacterales bacterium]|jgi:hypothetical protein|nr:hypothetical protein [Chthoniobacterales bacterium]